MTNRIDELDLDDPEVYDLVRKTNKIKNNNNEQEQNKTQDSTSSNYIIDETPVNNNNCTMFDFIKKLLIVCICVFLIYLFIYKYIIGNNNSKRQTIIKSEDFMCF